MDLPATGRPRFCSSLPSLSSAPSYLEISHEEPPEQAPITRAPERRFIAYLAARLPRKGPSAFLFSILFLTLVTNSALSHPVVCQCGHVPPSLLVRIRHTPSRQRRPTLYLIRTHASQHTCPSDPSLTGKTQPLLLSSSIRGCQRVLVQARVSILLRLDRTTREIKG